MSHTLGRLIKVRGIAQGSFRVLSTTKIQNYSSSETTAFKTSETNPGNHTKDDIGLIYGLDNSYGVNGLFGFKNTVNAYYKEECTTFNETYMMIRKPALEIIHYLKNANYDDPIIKYVLYGKSGSGKSMTLLNVVHYAHLSGWLIFHVPSVIRFLIKNTERVPSKKNEQLIDLPAEGSAWLLQFKSQNLDIINKLDLRLQNDHKWFQAEHKKGDSLLSFLDFGISRGTYSSDVIMALTEEVKLLSKNKIVKTLVAINPYSILFGPGIKSQNKKWKYLTPAQVSFFEGFKNLALSDWNYGAAVLTCYADKEVRSDVAHLPLAQLGRKGFEFLDPFIPIHVPPLTNKEMESLLAYYKSKRWLPHSKGDKELKLISCGNFEDFRNLSQFA